MKNKNNNYTSNVNYYDASFASPQDVMLSENKTSITILNTSNFYNYTLYNAKTGIQAEEWKNGAKGTVVFSELNPKFEYAVRVMSREDLIPMPIVKPEIIIVPVIPMADADIIVPEKEPTYNKENGCGMISIKADSNHGYAVLNDKNMPLSDKQLKKWGIKVTDDKGYLLPKTDDGYFFGCKTKMFFKVPAGGEYKMGGKNLSKKYTFINGPVFITPGLYYNAWYCYIPPYFAGQKGTYNLIIDPACEYTDYKLYNMKGIYQKTKIVKAGENRIFIMDVNPLDSYVTGSPRTLET